MEETHLHGGSNTDEGSEVRELNMKNKILNNINQLKFQKECLEEQGLPRWATTQLRRDSKPFTGAERVYQNI